MTKAKLYKLGNTLIGLIVILIAIRYLYDVFSERTQIDGLFEVTIVLLNSFKTLSLVVLLCLLNWGLELGKWKLLTQKIQKLSYKKLLQSILLGITLGLLTPNRIGELGGRLQYIKKGNRVKAFYYHSFSSITQLLLTFIIGLLGIVYLSPSIKELDFLPSILRWPIAFFLILLTMGLFFFSNTLKRVIGYFSSKFNATLVVPKIDIKDRIYLFLLSAGRYVVFTVQFGLLLQLLEADFTWMSCLMGLSVVFLMTAVIPTGLITDMPVKTSLAFYIFEKLEYDGINAIVCSFMLWIINLFIPALIGLTGLRKINWLQLKNETH